MTTQTQENCKIVTQTTGVTIIIMTNVEIISGVVMVKQLKLILIKDVILTAMAINTIMTSKVNVYLVAIIRTSMILGTTIHTTHTITITVKIITVQ